MVDPGYPRLPILFSREQLKLDGMLRVLQNEGLSQIG